MTFSGFLSREKTFANFAFLWRFANVFSAKTIFKQIDTALLGVVHWDTANSRMFSLRKCIFKQFAKGFSRERNPLYGISVHAQCAVLHSIN